MPNTLADLVNIIAQIKLATIVAQTIGITVPAELTTFETAATAALDAATGFEVPQSLTADLTAIAAAATALSGLASGPTMTGIISVLQRMPATATDLTSGQLAIIGTVGAQFAGVADKVVIGAYRQSGQFAKMVDSGTTDTASIT